MKQSVSLFILALVVSLSAQGQYQRINTFAGIGIAGFSSDGSAATGAQFNGPVSVAAEATGNVYIVDFFNLRVRKVNTSGIITTVAGNGAGGYAGDGSIATSAQLHPHAVGVDNNGNIYISDGVFGVIRKVNTSGIISTIAGTGTSGYAGDGGSATAALLNHPHGIAFDRKGKLIFADAANHMIRKIDGGIISKIAGNGAKGYSGDGSTALSAKLDSPFALATDRKGNIYVADMLNNAIRKIDTFGNITTYVGDGTGTAGYAGNGGLATLALLNMPAGVAVDTIGNLYIADANNNVIRKVDTFGIISTVVGDGTAGYGGDLGYAYGANLNHPYDVAVNAAGNLFIADANNHRVRKTYSTLGVETFASQQIDLFPNPATHDVTVSNLTSGDYITITNIVGQQIQNTPVQADGELVLDISSYIPGMYILSVSDAQGIRKSTMKFVKE